MLRGSCLCGQARYEISGKLYDPLNCHCSMCRKAQGAAFRFATVARTSALRLIADMRADILSVAVGHELP